MGRDIERDLLDIIQQMARDKQSNKGPGVRKDGTFKYIGYRPPCFVKLVECLKKAIPDRDWKSNRFLDVGCGIGLMMELARTYFGCVETHGIEYTKIKSPFCWDITPPGVGSTSVGCRRVGSTAVGCRRGIIRMNALSFQHYGDYDIIYWYRPICCDKKQRRLEELICTQAKPGTILMPVYTHFLDEIKGVTHVEGACYAAYIKE